MSISRAKQLTFAASAREIRIAEAIDPTGSTRPPKCMSIRALFAGSCAAHRSSALNRNVPVRELPKRTGAQAEMTFSRTHSRAPPTPKNRCSEARH